MAFHRLRWILIFASVMLITVWCVMAVIAAATHRTGASGAQGFVPAPLATGTALERPRPVPDMRLIDDHGRPFSLEQWHGRWVVFASTMTLCHEVCPMTTGALMRVRQLLRGQGLGRRVIVAEVTVDPWRDSPARLRAYRRLTGADFELLTGTRREIRRWWKFFGVAYRRVPQGRPPDRDWLTGRPETFDVQHTDGLFMLDPAGQERVVEEGMPNVHGHLSRALRSLLNSQGRANLAHPQLPWTADDVLDDVDFLLNRNIPAADAPHPSAPSPVQVARDLTGSPGTLAALHRQRGRLLGPMRALALRLRSLRGYPVVINTWASWCPACRGEFASLASVAAQYGRRVAFLGVDTDDTATAAAAFLKTHPVSYPSYEASSAQLASLAVIEGLPDTIFVDPHGKVVDVHTGAYDTAATLRQDVARYALGARGSDLSVSGSPRGR